MAVKKKVQKKKRASKVDEYAHLLGCVKDKYIVDNTGVTMPAVSRYRAKHNIKAFKQNIKVMADVLPKITAKTTNEAAAKKWDLPEALVAVCRKIGDIHKNKAAAIKKHKLSEPIVEAVLMVKAFAKEEMKPPRPIRAHFLLFAPKRA